ncbi:serine/threonine-protein kinase ATR [Zeugodacus cucurbitae]|uniref:serine/threonine-protein kinase ATR n=1 Tax=Zeugodacus cucurbitae TaxID=28588 RepID=UPI0023D96034|nr:serine/threonine-protein kinase ATR [Zeugodacus cucurbitae]
MSTRRKDIWKLLYNLVSRDGTDLNDVFAFVDDILCREPSLIRPSLRELNNRFQDTFVLWIINKFINGLSDTNVNCNTNSFSTEGMRGRNIELQEKILHSCLVNRALLFERLVAAYIRAIEQLTNGLQLLDEQQQTNQDGGEFEQYLEVTAFFSEDLCLREIDADFSFKPIRVSYQQVDERVRSLLQVLHNAALIGYSLFPQIFAESLLSVLQVVRECDLTTKLLALRYCQRIFELAGQCTEILEHYGQLTMQGLALIWGQVPLWLHARCIRLEELDGFKDVSIAILRVLKGFSNDLQWTRRASTMLALSILYNCAELEPKAQHKNEAKNLDDLMREIVEFIIQLPLEEGEEDVIVEDAEKLMALSEKNVNVLLLLSVILARADDKSEKRLRVLKFFKERIFDTLNMLEIKTDSLKRLKYWMQALIYAEHRLCQRKQLNALRKSTVEQVVQANYYSSINLFATLVDNEYTSQLDRVISRYHDNSFLTDLKNFELSSLYVDICALLMNSISLRGAIEVKTQLILLQRISNSIEAATQERRPSCNLQAAAFESFRVLSTLHIDGPVELTNHLRKLFEGILSRIFNANPILESAELLMKFRKTFCEHFHTLIACGWLTFERVLREFVVAVADTPSILMDMLRNSYCPGAGAGTCHLFLKVSPLPTTHADLQHYIIVCQLCNENVCATATHVEAYIRSNKVILLECKSQNKTLVKAQKPLPLLPAAVRRKLCETLLTQKVAEFTPIGRHLHFSRISADDLFSVLQRVQDISKLNLEILHTLVPKLIAAGDEQLLMKFAKFLLQQILKSLQTQATVTAASSSSSSSSVSTPASQRQTQLKLLELLTCCAHSDISEIWLFHLFKLTFFYLLHPQSEVVQEAVLCATEMCAKHGLQPVRLWNWYKRDALTLVVQLAVQIFLKNGVRLTRSLKAFTKMLGFSCVQEFICRYYRLLTTMILPYCVKEPLCKGLIVCISKVTRKPISTIFVASFLRIYTHIYLTEEAEVGNKCIELIVRCTEFSLKKLMNTDVKQTVSEFLIYFNRNPQFVMKAFQCLLFNDGGSGSSSEASSSKSSKIARTQSGNTGDFAKFIADRFLGVITYFETCLAEPTFEKPLKEEALYSLGQILRFVGAKHVTQFRFKIIAMLSFVLSLQDRHLQSICLKVWNIFLHIVNIEELGPSLSRIVASLQPLLAHSESEVNAIYEFVILKNDSLLGAYIPDLYFVEQLKGVAPTISHCVARQTEILKSERSTLLEKFEFLYRQITNENSQVRIYGLTYLRNFVAAHRADINHMVLSEMLVDPLIENLVDALVAGCKHEDTNLQLSSAKCLGELGAIDPSYITTNHTFEQRDELPLSVHTDGFAIMALSELCRAYQFQKDTKYVDNFSLAIQETLAVCGVSPCENKKLNVWEALPARMRQVMEPLLTSCYTNSRRESTCADHPIFNSSYCRSYADWAFNWSARLIDFVQADETKHLLNSYKPSIKRDNNTLITFFPYILLHALQDGNESQRQKMYEEFEAVFSFSSAGIVEQPVYEASGLKEFVSAKYATDLSTAGESAQRTRNGQTAQYDGLEHIGRTCTKLCSEQIDFLQRWVREWQRINSVGGKVNEADKNYKCVRDFLQRFNKLLIAKANYHSDEYARALMYLEAYIEETDTHQRLQEQISFLIEIHGELLDADSVEGAVYVKKTSLSLDEEIMVNRIVDRPQELQTCYEQLMCSDEPISQEHIKGMINCYLRMDTPETALLITDGLWQKLTDHYTDDYFKECKSELLWRLGRYDELQELLEDSVVRRKTSNWNIQCAEAFLLYRKPIVDMPSKEQATELSDFTQHLDEIRRNVLATMRSCSVINHKSYPYSYEDVVKLHLLNEMEKNKQLTHEVIDCYGDAAKATHCLTNVREFFTDWDRRLCVLQPVVRVMEPILCFRRNLLVESKRLLSAASPNTQPKTLSQNVVDTIDAEIGKLWLRSVQMYREAGSLQQAQLCIMKAAEYAPKTLFIEKAKLLWQKGDQAHAFKLLEEQLERMETQCERNVRTLSAGDRALYAEAKYLQATYSAESMNSCAELNLRYFREAILGNHNSEKCYVQLAQYMEKIYESFSAEQQQGDTGRKLLLDIMVNYAKSLKSGCENVYQSLPRLLSLWLDYTSRCASVCEATSSDPALATKATYMQEVAKKMNELLNNCANALPTAIFYTAFSQLLSRICHPSADVFAVLRTIVIKLLEHFPQQSLWMLLPILKSAQTNRVKRCKLIFTDARLAKPQFQKQLNDFNILAERLIELTNKDVAHDRTYELSALVKQLPKLFEDPKFSNILLPFEKYMQASFPLTSGTSSLDLNLSLGNLERTSSSSSSSSLSSTSTSPSSVPANPFPYQQIYISGIKEEITVLRSAAKPKKITIQCSDGKCYEVMVKPKDDLRKDFRLMEFNGLVKRFLHQDSQARHRCLRIRTYAAIPFNEECGLVEWLPKLNSFRAICNSVYRMRGLGLPDRMLRQCALPRTDPIEKKRSVFLDTLLPAHPPVFQEWLRRRFSTPNSWYEARCAYVKTVAVMSMVGYILGLGDRHGENLLFDETTGDAVHVDFNCLFNQGELFAYPELVPFRLTHNMVYAMGPLGVEGLYRRCCEITIRVLKKQSKTLMSVLRPFVYDLVALNRSFSGKTKPSLELTDPKALMDVRRIEERLQGYVKRTQANSMPLSTEGQVNFLIAEATSIDNLAAMYIGWGSYI